MKTEEVRKRKNATCRQLAYYYFVETDRFICCRGLLTNEGPIHEPPCPNFNDMFGFEELKKNV